MSSITYRFALFTQADDAQFVGYAYVIVLLAQEETELAFLSGQKGRVRVFYDGCSCRISHDETAWSASLELVGKQSESIGIPLEVCQVFPFRFRKRLPQLQPIPL